MICADMVAIGIDHHAFYPVVFLGVVCHKWLGFFYIQYQTESTPQQHLFFLGEL
jgi:hypothetical protein